MAAAKIAVTIDRTLLNRLDQMVRERRFPNRSKAVQEAVLRQVERLDRSRLARECGKLDRCEEITLAEEGFAEDMKTWPAYCEATSFGRTWNQRAVTSKPVIVRWSF